MNYELGLKELLSKIEIVRKHLNQDIDELKEHIVGLIEGGEWRK